MTHCDPGYLGYFTSGVTSASLLGLPAFTQYEYTTVVPFGASWNEAAALVYGLNTFASEVATYLHLTVPSCNYTGGGSGTLKIAVTALTSVSMTYVTAAADTTTESLANSQTPQINTPTTRASPSQAPPARPSPTAPPAPQKSSSTPVQAVSFTPVTQIAATPPASLSQLGSSSGQSIAPQPADSINTPGSPNGGEVTTIARTISGPSGLQTVNQVTTIGPGVAATGSYTTTLVETTSGPSGLETLSEVATLAIGLFIASIMGIGGATEAVPTSTLSSVGGSGSGSQPGSTSTSPGPVTFEGGACRLDTKVSPWGIPGLVIGLAFGLLS